ncbi:30S ribosomal protein S2 [bacterium]|nr:30S ribosomal protein S2 [bacterium]
MVQNKKRKFGINLEEMLKAGLHFGHSPSKRHPKMEPFLFGVRNGIHVIDLEKTVEKLEAALEYIQNLISEGKNLLFVGTKIQVKELIKETAKECNLPYVAERWLGGTFTNFDIIKKRIEYYKDLEKKKKEGELDKYPREEKIKFEKILQELEQKYGGLQDVKDLPDAIFVVDVEKEKIAISEARKKGIKIIAICDTNGNPTLVDYPIPANDDSVTSVKYILDKVKEVIKKAKSKAKSVKEKE